MSLVYKKTYVYSLLSILEKGLPVSITSLFGHKMTGSRVFEQNKNRAIDLASDYSLQSGGGRLYEALGAVRAHGDKTAAAQLGEDGTVSAHKLIAHHALLGLPPKQPPPPKVRLLAIVADLAVLDLDKEAGRC